MRPPPPVAQALPGAQALPCALATVTSEGLLLAVNPALSALLGRDATLCCGGPFDALLSTAGGVIYQSYLMPLLRLHGHLQEFSMSLKCADGQALEVLLYASSRHCGPQRVHDLVMVPIRQRHRVEEEMLRVKRAADESPGMIFQLLCLPDGSGHFPYVSEAVRALYGSTPQAARESADTVFGRVLAEDRAALLQARDAAAASESPWRASARIGQPDGSVAWHEFNASPRRLANGMTLWHGHVADVTQRRAMEQALADREAARQASQAKSEFLARVSHELRTPLNGILGFAHLLLNQQADNLRDDQRRRLAIVQTAGQGLLHLINDVLDITSIEMGQLSLHPAALPLAPAVDAALAVVEPQAQAAGVRLARGHLAGLVVQADARRLQQVLVNLLSNAIKYNRPGGLVDVRARSEAPACPGQAMACIEVIDTGLGLTDAQQQELFQPFNRLGAEHGPAEGTGLGLVISRQLVQLMQGSIGVRSVSGQGSCFLVRLPLGECSDPAQAQAQDQAGAGAGLAGTTQGRVLYVEDNAVNVLLMQAIIGLRSGVRMQVCGDCAAGLAAALAEPPDLLLLDMQLPDGDGSSLLQRMRAHPALAAVPAVAVSAAVRSDDLARARCAGFAAYWTKPLAVDEVLAGLDRLLAPPLPGQSPP
ncbi:MAG: ATP-binding protein [Aquabacterium sp.]|nr:ATP-binding protein [Aquabacterium sp.]